MTKPSSSFTPLERFELSLDGSHACALYGGNLHDGEAEFVAIEDWPNASPKQESAAMSAAYEALAARLGMRPPFDIVREHRTPVSEKTAIVAWLVERPGPEWLAIIEQGFPMWTKDANKAIRFPSKDSAERVFATTKRRMQGFEEAVATEHEWPGFVSSAGTSITSWQMVKVVPVEPTTAMLEAAGHACDGLNLSKMTKVERSLFKAAKRWAAMLKAAPPQPAIVEPPVVQSATLPINQRCRRCGADWNSGQLSPLPNDADSCACPHEDECDEAGECLIAMNASPQGRPNG